MPCHISVLARELGGSFLHDKCNFNRLAAINFISVDLFIFPSPGIIAMEARTWIMMILILQCCISKGAFTKENDNS